MQSTPGATASDGEWRRTIFQGMLVCAGSWAPAAPQVLGSPSPPGLLQVNPAQLRGKHQDTTHSLAWITALSALPCSQTFSCTQNSQCFVSSGRGHSARGGHKCVCASGARKNIWGDGHNVTAAPWHLSWRCRCHPHHEPCSRPRQRLGSPGGQALLCAQGTHQI